MNGTESVEGKGFLLGCDQHGCEHTLMVLSSLVDVFTTMVTLALEVLRKDLPTLLVLLVLTFRFSGATKFSA